MGGPFPLPTVAEFQEQSADAGASLFRRLLVAQERESAERVQVAYRRLMGPTRQEIIRLQDTLTTPAEAERLWDLEGLAERMETALAEMELLLEAESSTLQNSAVRLGLQYSQMSTGITVGWNSPDPAAIRTLINYVDGEPFQDMLGQYGPYHAQCAQDLAIAGMARGWSPNRTARAMAGYVDRMPIADAERMMRTVQLYSYRRANVEGWRNNSNVVEGWYWRAALDERTCVGCVAQHGSRHTVREVLNDHHRGRCLQVPILPGRTLPEVNAGQVWFEGRSRQQQQMAMGRGRWEAWQDGRFEFGNISRIYNDPIYGEMRGVASLTQLVGADVAGEYAGRARAEGGEIPF